MANSAIALLFYLKKEKKSMTLAAILAQIALFLWFFGCIRTYRFGKTLLVRAWASKVPGLGCSACLPPPRS